MSDRTPQAEHDHGESSRRSATQTAEASVGRILPSSAKHGRCGVCGSSSPSMNQCLIR
jgi:hypothetical protein